jgi:preprotein translocase subunit YajC
MIRPQQKQKKKLEKQREGLKVGDKVIISSGIHGNIKEINEMFYMIEISENVKIKVDKLSVFAVVDSNECVSKK